MHDNESCGCSLTPPSEVLSWAKRDLSMARSYLLMSLSALSAGLGGTLMAASAFFSRESDVLDAKMALDVSLEYQSDD